MGGELHEAKQEKKQFEGRDLKSAGMLSKSMVDLRGVVALDPNRLHKK